MAQNIQIPVSWVRGPGYKLSPLPEPSGWVMAAPPPQREAVRASVLSTAAQVLWFPN